MPFHSVSVPKLSHLTTVLCFVSEEWIIFVAMTGVTDWRTSSYCVSLYLLIMDRSGNEEQGINAKKTQLRDHARTSCHNKLTIGERNSEWNDERNGSRDDEKNADRNGGENHQGCQCSFGNRPSAETRAGSTPQ